MLPFFDAARSRTALVRSSLERRRPSDIAEQGQPPQNYCQPLVQTRAVVQGRRGHSSNAHPQNVIGRAGGRPGERPQNLLFRWLMGRMKQGGIHRGSQLRETLEIQAGGDEEVSVGVLASRLSFSPKRMSEVPTP